MASAGEKSLAVGHIPGFQIDPKIYYIINSQFFHKLNSPYLFIFVHIFCKTPHIHTEIQLKSLKKVLIEFQYQSPSVTALPEGEPRGCTRMLD